VDTGAGFSGSWTYIASETIGYMHSPLNESYLYKYKVTVVGEEDGTETTGTIHDNAGAGYQPNASDQSAILADTIAAQHVIAQYDMITQTFIGGTLHSLNWGASAGTELSLDDEVIRLGGSGVGYNSGTGVWIGNDAGTYKLFVGDSTGDKLTWDGTTLSINGSVTIQSGSGIANLADAGALATLDVVGTAQISNLAVTTAKIDDLAVTGAKIADATITNAKIADLAVTSAKIADAAIDTAKIGDLAVTNIKLSGSITYDKIQSISLDSVVTGTLTSDYIVVNNDINFHPGSTWHSIMGCAYIEGYHSGTDIHSLRLGDYSTTSVLLKAGTNASLTLSPTGMSTLKSAGQLRLWTGDGTVYFDGIGGSDFEIDYATTATGNCNYAGGSIRVQIGGVTRRIKLWKI
jgi:hypothetical protein